MFFKRFGWLILVIVAFVSGIIITVQWIGTDYGMDLYELVKKPDIVEKIVEIEVIKVITISDNQKIQMINQEFRDALIKISSVPYTSGNSSITAKSFKIMQAHATKALAVPEMVYKEGYK